jgi:hypothetical protein
LRDLGEQRRSKSLDQGQDEVSLDRKRQIKHNNFKAIGDIGVLIDVKFKENIKKVLDM